MFDEYEFDLSDNLSDDLDIEDDLSDEELGSIFSSIGKALGAVAKVAAPIANFIPGVGPIVSGGLSMIGNAVTKGGAPAEPAAPAMAASPGDAVQNAIGAATRALPAGLGAAVQAAAPSVAGAIAGGVDATALIAALPDVVKSAVRETVGQMKAGQLSEAQAQRQLTASVGGELLPHLATAVSALREQKLQQQATMEHNAINARQAFKAEVREKLDRLLRQTSLTPAQQLLRRSI